MSHDKPETFKTYLIYRRILLFDLDGSNIQILLSLLAFNIVISSNCLLIRFLLKHHYNKYVFCIRVWLSSRNFFQGGKIYCYANFFCYAIVFRPNFREGQKFSGGQTASGGRPPVEESQGFLSNRSVTFKLRLFSNNHILQQLDDNTLLTVTIGLKTLAHPFLAR